MTLEELLKEVQRLTDRSRELDPDPSGLPGDETDYVGIREAILGFQEWVDSHKEVFDA